MPIFTRYQNGTICTLPSRQTTESLICFYLRALSCYDCNDYGEAIFYANETAQDVSCHLAEAARRRGLGIEIVSANRQTIFFRVTEPPQMAMEF
jgi:hypothetical protein